jgi:hypothetical protein
LRKVSKLDPVSWAEVISGIVLKDTSKADFPQRKIS